MKIAKALKKSPEELPTIQVYKWNFVSLMQTAIHPTIETSIPICSNLKISFLWFTVSNAFENSKIILNRTKEEIRNKIHI